MEKMKLGTENDLMAHHSIKEGKLHQKVYSLLVLICYYFAIVLHVILLMQEFSLVI